MGFHLAQSSRPPSSPKSRSFFFTHIPIHASASPCHFSSQNGSHPPPFPLVRGKNDKKKFNLVSWKQIIQTQDRGGLEIRSPKFLNLAFGGKIVWRFISGHSAWWKSVLEAKYLNFPRQHILDYDIPNRVCSTIWRLCKKAIPFLTQTFLKFPRVAPTSKSEQIK